MNLLDDYEQMRIETAIYPEEVGLPYLVLGLSSEAAELEHIETERELILELGDVQWYICGLCQHHGLSFKGLVQNSVPTDCCPETILEIAGSLAGVVKKRLRDQSTWGPDRYARYMNNVRMHIRALIANSIHMASGTKLTLNGYSHNSAYMVVLRENINKLRSRQERDKLRGDGDNR